jgi:diamine N-acetyltransferase
METRDVDLLCAWENDSSDWWMGATLQPISREAMMQFVQGTSDLYHARQCRWMLDHKSSMGWQTTGALDFYNFDPRQRRAGVAVHIARELRQQGHALAGLTLLAQYAQQHLGLNQLYAEIPASHNASRGLFVEAGYEETGLRQRWVRTREGHWDNLVTCQLFLESDSTSS